MDSTTLDVGGKEVTRRSENMLTATPGGGHEYYLSRKAGANACVAAGVRGDSGLSASIVGKSISGVAGIDLVLTNWGNSSNEISFTTDRDGALQFDGVNVGFVAPTEAQQNFKVSYQRSGSDQWGYYYAEPNNDETQGTAAHLNAEYLGYLGVYDLDFHHIHNGISSGQTVQRTQTACTMFVTLLADHEKISRIVKHCRRDAYPTPVPR